MKHGWKIKKLGDVCEDLFAGGDVPKGNFSKIKSDVHYIPIYSNGEKNKGLYGFTNVNRVNKPSITISARGTIGYSEIRKENFYPAIRLIVVIPKVEILDLSFLKYVISSIDFTHSGSSIPQLTVPMIREYPIPVPTLSEQYRIVTILDEAFDAITRVKANAERNLKNARELFESYLKSVFENKSDGWEEKKLGEVANTWGRIGWKGLTAKEYTLQGPLFLSVHSLNYGDYVDFRDAFHITQERYDESPEIMLRKDDILICKDGAGIGKLGIVPELPSITTINSSLLLIRCKKDILTKYLYYNLISPIFQSIVQSRLMGATTPHLYQRDIVTFPIVLPPKLEQQVIVQKLDALSAEIRRLEVIYKQKILALEDLKKIILQKAFNGELKTIEEIAV